MSDLSCFEFETVRVDRHGKVVERLSKVAESWDLDLGNAVKLSLVKIPAGQFWMGSPLDEIEREEDESPRHRVQVPEFWIGKYPVTQAQWEQVAALPKTRRWLKADPSHFPNAQCPVESVTWYEAQEFCRRVSQRVVHHICLPSEVQWEYACRAGTETPFAFGPTLNVDIANYSACYAYGEGSEGKFREETTTVGKFPANPWGLYDMHGNILEWCEDAWQPTYDGMSSKRSKNWKSWKVARGGSWSCDPEYCRSACRSGYTLGCQHSSLHGFRVACIDSSVTDP